MGDPRAWRLVSVQMLEPHFMCYKLEAMRGVSDPGTRVLLDRGFCCPTCLQRLMLHSYQRLLNSSGQFDPFQAGAAHRVHGVRSVYGRVGSVFRS